MDPWLEYEMNLSRQRNAWADAHLAAEKAVATWWRAAVLSFENPEWDIEIRQGVLVEQTPTGIPGDAVYPVNGRVRVSSTSGAELVYYECDTNYGDARSGGCVPADRDYDCGELRSWGITSIPVIGEDWMLLDDDGDGWACEPLVVAAPVAQAETPSQENVNQCDGVVGMLGCLLGR